jgi:hypothetical protein
MNRRKPNATEDSGRRRSCRMGFALAGLVLVGLFSHCAVPGKLYRVAPPIAGELHELDSSTGEVHVELTVVHRDVPDLFEVSRAEVDRGGRFRFAPVELAVAGHEYSKVYRAIVRIQSASEDRVLWRGEFSRREIVGSIELDCRLARPPRLGQPCAVRSATEHPWLVANGERTYDRLCAECHGVAGAGSARTGSANIVVAPDLTTLAARRAGEIDWVEITERIEGSSIPAQHGTRTMPVWGERLSAEYGRYRNADELVGATLDPVIVYLQSIQVGAPADVP